MQLRRKKKEKNKTLDTKSSVIRFPYLTDPFLHSTFNALTPEKHPLVLPFDAQRSLQCGVQRLLLPLGMFVTVISF